MPGMFHIRANRSTWVLTALLAVVVALWVSGVAFSSPTGSDGRVHLCFNQTAVNDGGDNVIAINAGDTCPTDYPNELVLNSTGPQGPQGPQGPPGASGPAGANGLNGINKQLADFAKVLAQIKKFNTASDKLGDKFGAAEKTAGSLEKKGSKLNPADLAALNQKMNDQLQHMIDLMQQLNKNNHDMITSLTRNG
jgi:hypothetical protein